MCPALIVLKVTPSEIMCNQHGCARSMIWVSLIS
jgi:hypothetical protein